MTATAHIGYYGYPVADLNEQPIQIGRRTVIVNRIFWDAEYDTYRAVGFYAKKDGTAGKQYAKPVMATSDVPADILEALEALK